MIFVTVGTTHKPFNSLLQALDAFTQTHEADILAQVGYATYLPKNFRWFRFCSPEAMEYHLQSAELVIAHGGLAIIGECLRMGKPLIVVPREPGEAVNPQEELVEYLASQGYLDYVASPEQLTPYLTGEKQPPQRKFDFNTHTPDLVAQFVEQVIGDSVTGIILQ